MVISTEKVIKKNCMEIQKDPKIAKAILRKKIRDGTVRLPDWDDTKKLQSSKPYGTGTKTVIEINDIE